MAPRSLLLVGVLFAACCSTPVSPPSAALEEDEVGAVANLEPGSSAETTADVNLRRSSSTSARIIDVLPEGTIVVVRARSGSWYSVYAGSETGWVSGRYLAPIETHAPDAGAVDAEPASPDAEPAIVDGGSAASSCPAWASASRFTCAPAGDARARCETSGVTVEPCARGCLRTSDGDDVCLEPEGSASVSCPGTWGTTKASDGDYYLTAFGCWVDAAGAVHTDSGDNCIPSCLSEARASGLCRASDSGPACEERVTWYTADGGRFGCLARLRITNPANGRSVVAVALDFGPGCRVERAAGRAVLDASGRVNRYLFGSDNGWSDRANVHVVEVAPTTPLGPAE